MRDRSLNEARVGDVERAMAGDHDAFASLIGLAADSMFGMAVLILRDHARAEDATQEAIFRAWRELPRLRDPNRFAGWLRRLVVNACYDEGRRLRRRAEVPLLNVDIRSIGDGSGHLAERDQIERVFRRLPIDQRVVLVLHHHLDMSQAEIAALLGIPLGTAKSRLRYGSSAFRAALAAEERSAQDTERTA